MRIDLKGKKAVISGSTAGIGLAVAQGLADAGAHVVINGRTQASVDRAIETLGGRVDGARVSGCAADLSTAEGCATLVGAVPDCDILVNNLGVFAPIDFFDVPDEEWLRYFNTNVMSGVRLARAYAPKMAERSWGRIVFIASAVAFTVPPELIHYSSTKTAQVAIARGLAKRLGGHGVTVNSILPGTTYSEGLVANLLKGGNPENKTIEELASDYVVKNRPTVLLRRPATVTEVANLVVYTCSEQAAATTGAALRVEGGMVDSI